MSDSTIAVPLFVLARQLQLPFGLNAPSQLFEGLVDCQTSTGGFPVVASPFAPLVQDILFALDHIQDSLDGVSLLIDFTVGSPRTFAAYLQYWFAFSFTPNAALLAELSATAGFDVTTSGELGILNQDIQSAGSLGSGNVRIQWDPLTQLITLNGVIVPLEPIVAHTPYLVFRTRLLPVQNSIPSDMFQAILPFTPIPGITPLAGTFNLSMHSTGSPPVQTATVRVKYSLLNGTMTIKFLDPLVFGGVDAIAIAFDAGAWPAPFVSADPPYINVPLTAYLQSMTPPSPSTLDAYIQIQPDGSGFVSWTDTDALTAPFNVHITSGACFTYLL